MKKIALIMDGWKRFFTFAWPAGVLEKIEKSGEDVNLYIFDSSGNWSKDEKYNRGEYNIFNLPNLQDFDGIIVDLNNVERADIKENMLERIRESKVPAISIASEYEGFYYAGINNYAAMQDMMRHLVTKHECKTFWFVMGAEDNYENMQRTRGIQDYLKEQHISCEDDNFYFGNYEFSCGESGMKHFLETYTDIPDAIVCANDNIAVGVCAEAEKHGIKIPEDVLVTGFDDFDKASFYLPRITTVSHIREEVGSLCADMFLRMWKGEDVSKFNYTQTKPVFQESCGCTEKTVEFSERQYLKNQILYGIESTEFDETILNLEYDFMKCNSTKEMIGCIKNSLPAMRCDGLYLVMDERINDFKKQKSIYDKNIFEEEHFQVEGYPKRMAVKFAYENGQFVEPKYEWVENIFPMFEYDKPGTDFLFLPLHFREQTIGYFVVRQAIYLMKNQYLFQVVNSLTTAMENLHKKEKMDHINQLLSELYIRDSMTMLYNRSGYWKYADELFHEKKKQKENLLILYMDLDSLKLLNDTYGHEMGDIAIKAVANALLHCSSVDAIPVRLGGDEFLLIDHIEEEAKGQQLAETIRKEVHMNGKKMKCPIDLNVSIGTVITDMTKETTLEEYVSLADEKMYQEKCAKKVERK